MINNAGLKLVMSNQSSTQFTKQEAFDLLYEQIILEKKKPEQLDIHKIGVISGFIDINDEIEIIVKFIDRLEQFTKFEFSQRAVIVQDS